jgi:shikimate dehydrogenase
MNRQNKLFGLIGYPLGHSYSKNHFSRKFEHEGLINFRYDNFEIPSIELLVQVINENPDLAGLNVTIPYKQLVLRYLDEIDPEALIIGAVNTIKIIRSESKYQLKGYNTDSIGFLNSVSRWPISQSVKAIVFGTGGSSLAVKFALSKLGLEFTSVSRNSPESLPYDAITPEIAIGHKLWINCTPVGMFPANADKLPLPYECLTEDHFLYDLVYNPDVTAFLEMGIKAGSKVMNGRNMLFEQAEASWKIWNNPPD